MAARTVTLQNGGWSTDADFRTWGLAVADTFILGGWVRTSDSGQIDWTTVLKPSAAGQIRGYDIFRSNDAGGGLFEIYVKVEYGSAAANLAFAFHYLTVGFGSDGVGNLTGTISTKHSISLGGTTASTSCNLAGGPGWVSIVMGDVGGVSYAFFIERTVNSAFQFRNEIVVYGCSSAVAWFCQVVERNVFAFPQSTNGTMFLTTTDSRFEGKVGLSMLMGVRGHFTNPVIGCLGVGGGYLGGNGNTLTINQRGAPHTYIVNAMVSNNYFGGKTTQQLLSRYE